MSHHTPTQALTTNEWEAALGSQIRAVRLEQNLTQQQIADRANVDRTTVTRIEKGAGGNVASLVQIARALGREDWLANFAPPTPAVSPMQLLRDRQRSEANKRQRARPQTGDSG